jgi:hypothetical protein
MIGNFEHVSSPVPEDVAVAKKTAALWNIKMPTAFACICPHN